MNDEQQSDDERALAALFAALVEDSPASQVSPAQVVELARQHQRAALDQRIRRLKFGRNVLLAAALVAVVALVLPHLGNSSSSSTASSSSSSSAADAAVPARSPGTLGAGAGSSARSAADATQAASGAAVAPGVKSPPAAAAASSAAAAASQVPAAGSVPAASGAASVAAAGSSAASAVDSAGLTSAGAPAGPNVSGAAAGRCPLLPAAAITAIKTALPAGDLGIAVPTADCDRYGVTFRSGVTNAATLTVLVSRSAPGGCQHTAGLSCSSVPGRPGAYQGRTTAGTSFVAVYGNGYQVLLQPTGSLTTAQLSTAGQAVVAALA